MPYLDRDALFRWFDAVNDVDNALYSLEDGVWCLQYTLGLLVLPIVRRVMRLVVREE